MKYLLILVALMGFGCASTSKYTPIVDRLQCYAMVLEPYSQYFTEDMAKSALAELSNPKEVLEAVDVVQEEVLRFEAEWNSCKQ